MDDPLATALANCDRQIEALKLAAARALFDAWLREHGFLTRYVPAEREIDRLLNAIMKLGERRMIVNTAAQFAADTVKFIQ